MRIAIAGHSGFIGTALKNALNKEELVLISRKELYGTTDLLKSRLKKCDVVINLAGAPVSSRWSAKNRKRIKESRIIPSKNLIYCMNQLNNKDQPGMFIQASAIGIYDGVQKHTEKSKNYENNFLAEVVKSWEKQTEELKEDISLTIIRIGLVLDKGKGALKKIEPLFRFGLGATLGNGKQVYSYIHIDDVVNSVLYIINHRLSGVFNLTSPNPVTNKEFSKKIAQAMKRPHLFQVPEFAMKLILGKSAILVTRGQRVLPENLINAGYKFKYSDLHDIFNRFY